MQSAGLLKNKGFWNEEGDKLLKIYAEQYKCDWKKISDSLSVFNISKSGKQCRERWLNYVSPDINHDKLTPEEDDQLFNLYSIYGPQWLKISIELKNRSEIAIKNAFYCHTRRIERFFLSKFKELGINKSNAGLGFLNKVSENLKIAIHRLSELNDEQIISLVKDNKKVSDVLPKMPKEKDEDDDEIEEPQRRSKRIIEKLERKEEQATLKLNLKLNLSEIDQEKDGFEENLPSIKSFFLEDQRNISLQNYYIKPTIFSKSAFELPKFLPDLEVFNIKKRKLHLVALKSQKLQKWKQLI